MGLRGRRLTGAIGTSIWAAPIGIGVDTFYTAAGVANGADRAYWVGLVALVAVQAAMIVVILMFVHHRNRRRRTIP
jgi:hypothetical protein